MILNFNQILAMSNVCENLKKIQMPFKLSLILAKNISKLNIEREFYMEREREFAMTYLEIDEETQQFKQIQDGVFKIKDGKEEECREAREALNNFTTEVELHMIPMSLIENMTCFTPADLEVLEPLIIEEE